MNSFLNGWMIVSRDAQVRFFCLFAIFVRLDAACWAAHCSIISSSWSKCCCLDSLIFPPSTLEYKRLPAPTHSIFCNIPWYQPGEICVVSASNMPATVLQFCFSRSSYHPPFWKEYRMALHKSVYTAYAYSLLFVIICHRYSVKVSHAAALNIMSQVQLCLCHTLGKLGSQACQTFPPQKYLMKPLCVIALLFPTFWWNMTLQDPH